MDGICLKLLVRWPPFLWCKCRGSEYRSRFTKRRKIDRYIYYSMFQRNIISARANHLRMRNSCNRVREPTLSLLLYKNIQTMYLHTYFFLLLWLVGLLSLSLMLPKNDVAASDIFLLNNHSKWKASTLKHKHTHAAQQQHAKRFSAHNLWDSRWAFRFADWMTLADHHAILFVCAFEPSTLSISLLTLSKTNCQV